MHFLLPYELRSQHRPTKVRQEHHHIMMPYAKGIQTSGDFGTIISQVYKGKDYEVWQHHLFIEKDIVLIAYTDKAILTINYMLKGSPVAQLPSIGETKLHENSSQLFYIPALDHDISFAKGNYHFVQIIFSPSYIKRLTAAYPCLQQLVNCIFNKSEKILLHSSGKISSRMKLLLEQIIYCRMGNAETDMVMQSKILELLLNYIRKHASSGKESSLNKTGRENLHSIKEFIQTNIEKPLRIPALAKDFGISEAILYRYFKKHFGCNLSVFIKQYRLEKAMLLIKETDVSINRIALMVGYEFTENFNHAFKNEYGNSPGFYRRLQCENVENSQEK